MSLFSAFGKAGLSFVTKLGEIVAPLDDEDNDDDGVDKEISNPSKDIIFDDDNISNSISNQNKLSSKLHRTPVSSIEVNNNTDHYNVNDHRNDSSMLTIDAGFPLSPSSCLVDIDLDNIELNSNMNDISLPQYEERHKRNEAEHQQLLQLQYDDTKESNHIQKSDMQEQKGQQEQQDEEKIPEILLKEPNQQQQHYLSLNEQQMPHSILDEDHNDNNSNNRNGWKADSPSDDISKDLERVISSRNHHINNNSNDVIETNNNSDTNDLGGNISSTGTSIRDTSTSFSDTVTTISDTNTSFRETDINKNKCYGDNNTNDNKDENNGTEIHNGQEITNYDIPTSISEDKNQYDNGNNNNLSNNDISNDNISTDSHQYIEIIKDDVEIRSSKLNAVEIPYDAEISLASMPSSVNQQGNFDIQTCLKI